MKENPQPAITQPTVEETTERLRNILLRKVERRQNKGGKFSRQFARLQWRKSFEKGTFSVRRDPKAFGMSFGFFSR